MQLIMRDVHCHLNHIRHGALIRTNMLTLFGFDVSHLFVTAIIN